MERTLFSLSALLAWLNLSVKCCKTGLLLLYIKYSVLWEYTSLLPVVAKWFDFFPNRNANSSYHRHRCSNSGFAGWGACWGWLTLRLLFLFVNFGYGSSRGYVIWATSRPLLNQIAYSSAIKVRLLSFDFSPAGEFVYSIWHFLSLDCNCLLSLPYVSRKANGVTYNLAYVGTRLPTHLV